MYGGNIPLERYDKCQLKDDWLGKERDMIRIKWIKMWIADCRKPHWIAVQCISFWDVKRYDKCQLEDDWLGKEATRSKKEPKKATRWHLVTSRSDSAEYLRECISHVLKALFLYLFWQRQYRFDEIPERKKVNTRQSLWARNLFSQAYMKVQKGHIKDQFSAGMCFLKSRGNAQCFYNRPVTCQKPPRAISSSRCSKNVASQF